MNTNIAAYEKCAFGAPCYMPGIPSPRFIIISDTGLTCAIDDIIGGKGDGLDPLLFAVTGESVELRPEGLENSFAITQENYYAYEPAVIPAPAAILMLGPIVMAAFVVAWLRSKP